MALLTENERKAIFQELGLGEYNKANIKAFQKKYMLRSSDWDGIYGTNTDNTLRTVYYTKVYCKNFKPSEFLCECGGKYCCGYPSYMKPAELVHIQAIRDHYGKPITITSGLRCKTWNTKCGGSIQNSLHMSGLALDFYQSGVTDTLANRKASIKWIQKQPNHHYTYGNGINSYGNGISAPYMGNALHTDTNDKVEPKHPVYKESSKETFYKVIDVSDWQGQIDWKKVKADGVVGAIIRYGDGNVLDKRFAENMKNAKDSGFHIGSYIFSRAKTKAEAEAEATKLYNACKPYSLDMPLYIDLEVATLAKYANVVAQAFLNKMKSLGGRGGIYANLNWWNNYLADTAKNYSSNPFWVAQYNDTMDYKQPSIMGMWQYTSSGKVDGISGNVDMNKCYRAYWEVVDVNPIGKCANEYSYTSNSSKADYKTGAPTSAYKSALDKAYPDRSKWGTAPKKGASCDVFVGTCVINADVDKSFPRGLKEQIPYLAKSAKFKEVSVTIDTVKDGDIIVYEKTSGGSHICIVYGGKIKEAGYQNYYPKTTNTLKSRLSTSGKKWVKVYRAVEAVKKTVDELAQEVLDDKWDSGDERKKRLTEAGYDYDAVQKRVNELVEAKKTTIDKELDACKTQAEWMKNSKYKWESNPTVEKSKAYGTCVTYVACVLQRIGVLASGKCIWHDTNGKVYGNNNKMMVTYPKNKTLRQLKGELEAGDIIMDGDPKVVNAGEGGSHIFIITGKWSGNNPIVWDNHSAQGKKGKSYAYSRNRNVIAIVRLK